MGKEQELVKILTKKGYTITTAESCTGGLLSATIVNVEGASEVLRCSFVTYANEAKEQFAGVSHDTLERYGAVSEQTASEMCYGSKEIAGADIALSTTGIAGPGGGTEEKPVGLVYIGCCYHDKTVVRKCNFSGSREEVRRQSVETALDLAIECLNKEI